MYPGKYPPYDDGIKDDIFVHNATGGLLVGQVSAGYYIIIIIVIVIVKVKRI